jgi:hypothetical protein
MVKERRVRYTADIRSRANSNNYTNPVFRATMALEAGAESHVGATPNTGLRRSSTCPGSAFSGLLQPGKCGGEIHLDVDHAMGCLWGAAAQRLWMLESSEVRWVSIQFPGQRTFLFPSLDFSTFNIHQPCLTPFHPSKSHQNGTQRRASRLPETHHHTQRRWKSCLCKDR